jgi:large subunit ribosomal protein L9
VKIVLCEHVEHLGERGEIVSVATGYARNFLLPKRLAMAATPGNLRTLEHRRRMWEVKEAKEVGEAQGLAQRLGDVELTVAKKAGEEGTLYGSVTMTEIAELLAAKGLDVDRRRLVVKEPIKRLGAHEISIKLHRQVSGTIKLEVVNQASADAG